MSWDGRPILSTFGGHAAEFGGRGMGGMVGEARQAARATGKYLWRCRMAKGSKVFFIPCFFIPCFFMPPEKTIALPYVDGTFAWNNAWGASLIDSADTCRPIKNHTINLVEDAIFLDSVCSLAFSLRALSHDATKAKPYMAAVSPLFFTLRYHRTMGFQQVRSDPCARLTT